MAILFAFSFTQVKALTLTPVRIEVSGNPGDTVQSEITLINERETEETYYSSFSNFEAQGETGSPNFVDPTEGLGTWMRTDDVVTMAPGTSKIVPVTISIPANAEPGGYFAAVFFGTSNPDISGGGQVSIGAKTGVLVLLRVNGDVNEDGGILEFGTEENNRFFTSLPVSFYYRFQNSGGDRVKPDGDIEIKHFIGFTKANVPANVVQGNVLPGQIRRFTAVWQSKNGNSQYVKDDMSFFENVKNQWSNFAFGYYKANLDLTYGEKGETTSAKTSFWVVPWQLLLTLIVSLSAIFFAWKKMSKHRMESLKEEMREELMKEMENKSGVSQKDHIQF